MNYIWLTLSDLIQHFVSSVIMQNSEYMEIYFAAKVSVFLQYPPKLIAGETFKKTFLEVPLEAALSWKRSISLWLSCSDGLRLKKAAKMWRGI